MKPSELLGGSTTSVRVAETVTAPVALIDVPAPTSASVSPSTVVCSTVTPTPAMPPPSEPANTVCV